MRGNERRYDTMITFNAQIIKKEGKKEYVVIPYEEFLQVQEELHNYEDLRCLREAKEAEKDAPTVGIQEVEKRVKRRTSRPSRSKKTRG